jgi:membrane protein
MAHASRTETSDAWVSRHWLRLPLALRLPLEALAYAWRQNVMGMAGMIAFFGFLSLIPLVLLLLAFGGDFTAGHLSRTDVRHLFQSVVPGLSQWQFQHAYWEPIQRSHVATRVLGVVSLLLGSLGLHDSVDWAVNRLWDSRHGRSFWVMKLRGLGVIVWVVAFAMFSLVLTWLLAEVVGFVRTPALVTIGWVAVVPAVLVDVAIFAALYRLTPTVRVALRPAIVAAAVAAVLWELSKIAFGFWVLQVGSYNRVYGPLAASVIVMLWVWVSAIIFLYGAALCALLQRKRFGTA